MGKKIVIVQGHPDGDPNRLCRALAGAYAQGAAAAGHDVSRIDLAAIDFPLLKTQGEFTGGDMPAALKPAWEAILAANHIVIVFPLWLGTMPALLKAFLEQVMRPHFAYDYSKTGGWPKQRLKGRSARLVVTMGMPAMLYRLFYLSHGVAGLRRGILNFVGIRPVRTTLIGMVEAAGGARRAAWLERMRRLGAAAL
ncbi:NAD(P)H-dependent oxidoreductase [Mesorhizobium sp. KR9-304]|uniref:NAD(P)H-dependent oxidoreductase n=1 Tax=Mesorhizobium sp. KR9-304 TaxID=3156614 RepID=UPI0032B5A15D